MRARLLGLLLLSLLAACNSSSVPPSPPRTPGLNSPSPSPASSPEGFVPSDQTQRDQALGKDVPSFFLTMHEFFAPIPRPESRDWLATQVERGQSHQDYEALKPNVPDEARQKIYLQALGPFEEDDPSLEQLRDYTSTFFGLEVVLLDAPQDFVPSSRVDVFTKREQWLTSDILEQLSQTLPDDAYCLLGVTMTDLYPGEGWNYVFGIATLKKRVGVYSLARYDPNFFGNSRGKDWRVKALERSCKVLTHETCHMMGMAHCIYYDCLMNGSNHLGELDSQNTFLCPICLRKLQRAVNPDFLERYRALHKFYQKHDMLEQATWIESIFAASEGTSQGLNGSP